eukprot:scaffold600347_cov31-Prasinocladus_malaysianus.AAC.1
MTLSCQICTSVPPIQLQAMNEWLNGILTQRGIYKGIGTSAIPSGGHRHWYISPVVQTWGDQ